MELTTHLAANVRSLRAARHWTQEHAAERCGMAPRMFQAIEAGDANATLVTLSRLADGFGVDGAALLAPARRRT